MPMLTARKMAFPIWRSVPRPLVSPLVANYKRSFAGAYTTGSSALCLGDNALVQVGGPICSGNTGGSAHTPSIAFRHLPPNSSGFGYATEGAFFTSAQLSTDAVGALRKVWVLITLRASLFGTFLQRTDVVNQCLEFGY